MPRYANSDLSEYRNLIFTNANGRPAAKAMLFGTMFHALLLESIAPQEVKPAIMKQLAAMREGALNSQFVRTILDAGYVERVQLWNDELTGLPCKSQTDIWVPDEGLIVDVKTTSARSYGEFLSHCEQYGYDRQAAFYLDGNPQANRFVILGVQKRAPFEVFYFEASAYRPFLENGRKKYRCLLRDIHRHGFIPSSWHQMRSLTDPLQLSPQ